MNANAFIKDVASQDNFKIKLITSLNEQDQFYFTYLLLKEQDVAGLEQAMRSKEDINLESFGIILATGPGLEPPIEAQEEVQRKIRSAAQSAA